MTGLCCTCKGLEVNVIHSYRHPRTCFTMLGLEGWGPVSTALTVGVVSLLMVKIWSVAFVCLFFVCFCLFGCCFFIS